MLTRRHAAEVIALVDRLGGYDATVSTDIITAFGPGGTWKDHQDGVYAPEEVFFATMLSLLGYLRDDVRLFAMIISFYFFDVFYTKPTIDEVLRRNAVFAEWERSDKPHPITYEALTTELLEKIRLHQPILARKFNDLDVVVWRKVVMGINTNGLENAVDSVADIGDNDEIEDHPAKRKRVDGDQNEGTGNTAGKVDIL